MTEREKFEAWVQFHPMGQYLKQGTVWFNDIIDKYQSKNGTSQASNQMQVMLEAWQARAAQDESIEELKAENERLRNKIAESLIYIDTGVMSCAVCGNEVETENLDAAIPLREAMDRNE